MLVTGQAGTGRRYYNELEAEQYTTTFQQSAYILPFKGFQIKSAKEITLEKTGNTRKPAIYELTIPDTHDRAELIEKYIPRLKDCLLIIPSCPAYMDVLKTVLLVYKDRNINVTLIRETIKDINVVTPVIPDCFRVHADTTLPINRVYASELFTQIGQDKAIAFLIAQHVVNTQWNINLLSSDEIFKTGYFLYVMDNKIITKIDNGKYDEYVRGLILTAGCEMIKNRFANNQSDEEIQQDLANYMD